MATYDVIVIGAGIEGSSCAYNLAKRGMTVLLLEQFPLPHTRGSSHGQSRITRYVYPEDFYVHMMTDAFPMWRTLEEESGEDFFQNVGVLDFHQLTSRFGYKVVSSLRKYQIPHERLSPKEVRQRFPAFNVSDKFYAIHDPSGGLLHADRALRAFQTVFRQMGGILKDKCPVTSIEPGKVVKVVTSKVSFTAKNVVIAAGPWAGKFTKALDLDVPLNPLKVVVLYWKADEDKLDLFQPHRMPCFVDSCTEQGFHIYGFPSGEYPGLVKVCLHDGPAIDPDARDSPDSGWILANLKTYLKSMFPWLSENPCIREDCIYTNTPDFSPYIDRHPKYSNIVIAAGFSGHGFKLAPVVGKAVSQLVLGESPSYNMEPFRLDRFNSKARL